MADIVGQLLARQPLISDQVNSKQVAVILHELQNVIESSVEGAVVEFGCYIGTTSLFIRRLLDELDAAREFHVYDSFAGLPVKTRADESVAGQQFKAGELAVSKKQFLHEFQKANRRAPIIHKAWFSELGPEEVPGRIAFAFLDGDFYESIRDSLALVVPRMQSGGIIIVDDYAREALPGAGKATRERFSTEDITVVHNLGVIHL
ncbi:class I SAM-dependent methyltransferase [Candidatus Saccharibacteria bacterium]|nr:class I SAM-dependent methyltransferase [Candidatus Saccharibacteria bacterium]